MTKRSLVRLSAMSACPLLALILSSCVGGLPVTVTSVTGTWEPGNPGTTSGGVPAERVDFTVGGYTYGSPNPLVCLIDVYHKGVMVGSTLATIGSTAGTARAGGVKESDPVEVDLSSPFHGNPSDATVSCMTKT
jgi:hypothetical protein